MGLDQGRSLGKLGAASRGGAKRRGFRPRALPPLRRAARWASFWSRRASAWRLPTLERSSAAARVLRKAAVGGRAMAARGSRRRALRLLLVVQLLAGRWRPAGSARGARGGEPGRGRGPRAAGSRSGAQPPCPFFGGAGAAFQVSAQLCSSRC